MMALGPKKKKTLYIAVGILTLLIIVCLFLDIMMNQGGRLVIIGAMAGVVAAAATLLIGKFFSKEETDEEEVGEETRFKRKRKDEEEDFVIPEPADNEQDDMSSKFMREDAPSAVVEDAFSAFDLPTAPEPHGADLSIPPSEQLRQRGFFGRKAAKAEPVVEEKPEEQPMSDLWKRDEPEVFDDDFANEGFEAPVLAFGDPSDNQVPSAPRFEMEDDFGTEPVPAQEPVIEPVEPTQPVYDDFAEYDAPLPEAEPEQIIEEPAVQQDIPEDVQEPAPVEVPVAEPVHTVAAETIAQPKENVLLKDIEPGMVIASAAPGQDIDSFFDGMSDEDIAYRDCVEVWASGAKNPMIKLLKYVDEIEDKKTAGLIGRECEYVNAMIDRMLYFSQLDMIDQALNMKEYNFSVLVKECLKRFSPFFMEKKIGLLWRGLDVNVITDKRWFIFALTQVIFNSVEFTPNGGKIAISAKKTDDYIDLIIDDSGEGIDHEELPYVFTAGFMGDDAPNPDETRTGMGLFITRSVMQKLGGECMADSTKGKGTRIVMRLPAMKEDAAQTEEK